MKRTAVFLTILFTFTALFSFTACGPSNSVMMDPPAATQDPMRWTPILPEDFPPSIYFWPTLQCYPGGVQKSTSGVSGLIMGATGYKGLCAIYPKYTIELGKYKVGTQMKVIVRQTSASFKDSNLPYWSHLWLQFNQDHSIKNNPNSADIYPLALSNGDEDAAEASFVLKEGQRTLDVALGFDPTVPVLTKAADQPRVLFEEIQLQAYLPYKE